LARVAVAIKAIRGWTCGGATRGVRPEKHSQGGVRHPNRSLLPEVCTCGVKWFVLSYRKVVTGG